MTSKELKRMSRTELLQMLLLLVEENDRLKLQLDEATKKLNNRNLKYSKAGSIAEAALQVNGVFEDAEKAAQQYLQNIKALSEHQSTVFQDAESAARKKAQSIIAEANAYKEASIREADAYWNHVRSKVRDLMKSQADVPGSGSSMKGTKRS